MNTQLELMQGLSKRQKSKIERLIKNEQANKTQTHAKSFKRKSAKGKQSEDRGQRRFLNSEVNQAMQNSQSVSSPFSHHLKNQNHGELQRRRTKIKNFQPFNKNLPIQGGLQGLFSYIMLYSYSQKQKKADQPFMPPEDLSFLGLQGQPLQLINNEAMVKINKQINQQLELIKPKIQLPFDQVHKEFTKKLNNQQFEGANKQAH